MNARAIRDHVAQVRQLPCLACVMEDARQPLPTEAHHLNAGGHAGQKRLAADVVVPLCGWHHRGALPGITAVHASVVYGPSLVLQPRQFKARYGNNDTLLKRTDELLEALA
jgi:hypothetical protein